MQKEIKEVTEAMLSTLANMDIHIQQAESLKSKGFELESEVERELSECCRVEAIGLAKKLMGLMDRSENQ